MGGAGVGGGCGSALGGGAGGVQVGSAQPGRGSFTQVVWPGRRGDADGRAGADAAALAVGEGGAIRAAAAASCATWRRAVKGRAPASADVLLWLSFRRVEAFEAVLAESDIIEELRRLRARHATICELSEEILGAMEERRKACQN